GLWWRWLWLQLWLWWCRPRLLDGRGLHGTGLWWLWLRLWRSGSPNARRLPLRRLAYARWLLPPRSRTGGRDWLPWSRRRPPRRRRLHAGRAGLLGTRRRDARCAR